MSGTRFEFKGDLATTSLAEVLQTIHHYKVSGVVTAVRDGMEKKIYLWNGDVIFASSGDRQDSLGEFLLRTGRISQEQFDKSVETLLLSGWQKRHGEVLVEMGVLTEQELFDIVVDQFRSILLSLFEWEDGEFRFEVGQYRTEELIQLHVPTRQAILKGVKSVSDARRLVHLLGPSWTVFDPAYQPGELHDLELEPGEVRLLSKVDGVKTLKDLVTHGPGDASHNAKLVYAFFALKLITRREPAGKSIKKLHWRTRGSNFGSDG